MRKDIPCNYNSYNSDNYMPRKGKKTKKQKNKKKPNIIVCIYYPKLPAHPTAFPLPLGTTSLFFMSVNLFLFCRYVHL